MAWRPYPQPGDDVDVLRLVADAPPAMPFDLSLAGQASPPSTFDYAWKDTALYALGVGAKRDELDLLYEGRGPKVLPSFAVVPKFQPMLDLLTKSGGNLSMLVHGGERVTVHRPLAPQGRWSTTATIRGFYDLRRLSQVLIDTRTEDESKNLVATTTSSMIFRGEGGFGGDPPPKEKALVERPRETPPSFSIEETTSPEQALLYRLSGDHNPLHADPDFARAVGFEQGPLLHGLCTFGFMVRHVARGACGGDATRLRGFEAQFKRPVWPGDTLVTEGWIVRPGEIAVQVRVKERDEVVIDRAWATLVE
jgi:acyl dehydratase